jgi:uncharacterized membrane protein (DUF485 family)
LLITMVYVMAWVLALVYVRFVNTSLDRMAASPTGGVSQR